MGEAWARVAGLSDGLDGGRRVSIAARRMEDGREWALDADRVYPAASTIKTPILIAVYRAVEQGTLSLDEPRPIAPADRVVGSGVLSWMSPDLLLPLRDHAYLMIAISDNTASNVMLGAAGEERVREVLAELGMTGTSLGRRFLGRMPGPDEGENYTCASDLMRMIAALVDDTAASPASCAAMRALLSLQQDSDALARRLPAAVTFAGKSGWNDAIRHDSGLLSGPNGQLAVAVLTDGFTDRHEADELIGRIGAALVEESGIA